MFGVLATGLIAAFDVEWLDPLDDAAGLQRFTEVAPIVALLGAACVSSDPAADRSYR